MATEPLNLFSYKIDPAGALTVLRSLAADLKVVGTQESWEKATVCGQGRLFRKPPTITFTHDPVYYSGPEWGTQLKGMEGYFSRFPVNDNTPRVMLLIQSFRFALAISCDPELDLERGDERLKYIYAVAKHLDAAIFTPSSLRDSQGRILIHATADPDPEAVFPAIFKKVSATPRTERRVSQGGAIPDEGMEPPTPERVAKRARALAAVAGRGLLAQEDPADPGVEETRRRIIEWINLIGIADELEPEEWKVLQRPLRALEQREAMNSTWRIEGLAVLAWALNQFALPDIDQLVDPGKLLPSVGLLNADRAKELLAEPRLRTGDELRAMSQRLFAIHWRLRDFRLRPQAMNFREFARTAWFGPLDISNVRLIDDDLALGEKPISQAATEAFQRDTSAAQERHMAINWLSGQSVVYSQTDTST